METHKRKALEAAGFRVGTVAEFLGLTEAEERLIELRVRLVQAIRRLREAQGVSQAAFAKQLKSSQSRVAKIEAGDPGVSLDLTFRSYFALGGDLAGLADGGSKEPKRAKPNPRSRRIPTEKSGAKSKQTAARTK